MEKLIPSLLRGYLHHLLGEMQSIILYAQEEPWSFLRLFLLLELLLLPRSLSDSFILLENID